MWFWNLWDLKSHLKLSLIIGGIGLLVKGFEGSVGMVFVLGTVSVYVELR
jgi:hypothetical protein